MNVNLPGNVVTIGHDAFRLVRNVVYHGTAVGRPWGAQSVNGYVESPLVFADSTKTLLAGCDDWATDVNIPKTVTAIAPSAFESCICLKHVSIPNTVTTIGNAAFRECGQLTDIVFPHSVTLLGEAVCENCTSLSSAVVSNAVTVIGDNAFHGCTSLAKVQVPTAVTAIGNSAFSGCKSLGSIAIPNTVTAIGGYAFDNCVSLSHAILPKDLTIVSQGMFNQCVGLQSVVIPAKVEKVEIYAFYNCRSLSEITCFATEAPRWFRDPYFSDGILRNVPVYIPRGSKASYRAEWSQFSNFIELGADYNVRSDGGDIVVDYAAGRSVGIYNLSGRLIYQGNINSSQWRFAPMHGGIYLVRMADDPAHKVFVIQ